METRIAVIGIIVENKDSVESVNELLHQYSQYIIGRMGGHNGIEYRDYSSQQTRIGAHAKLDYHINSQHKLTWYNGYMDMQDNKQ